MTGQMMPWHPYHYGINDWAASFYASMMIAFQDYGYETAIFTHLATAETTDLAYDANALTSSTKPWVGRNVFEMWSLLG
jgi:hypothetical protein